MKNSNNIDILVHSFPFPVVRHVLEYVPMLPRIDPIMRSMFTRHYARRVCRWCGEFRKCGVIKNRDPGKCLCRSRYRRGRFIANANLTVSIRPIIICIIDAVHKLKNTGVIHTMSTDIFQFIDDIYSENNAWQQVEHFCFIVHRQPKRIMQFRAALRFLEKRHVQDSRRLIRLYPFIITFIALNMIESVVNMCTEVLAVSDTRGHLYDAHTYLSSSCSKIDDGTSTGISSHHDSLPSGLKYSTYGIDGLYVRLPFIVPVSYLYPFHKFIQDLPADATSKIFDMFNQEMRGGFSQQIPYDPLHILPPSHHSKQMMRDGGSIEPVQQRSRQQGDHYQT